MKLTITIEGETKTYQLEGDRKDSSYYLFSLPTEELGGKHFWLLQQALTGAYSEYVLTGTVEIQIDYYDISGALVDTFEKKRHKIAATPAGKFRRGYVLIQFQNQFQGFLRRLSANILPFAGEGEFPA